MKTASIILSVLIALIAFISNLTASTPLLRATSCFMGMAAVFAATAQLLTRFKK